MTASAVNKTPWHLWAVGVVGVLWNAYGAYDYFMSKTGGEAYLRSVGMTDAQIAYYDAMPSWMTVVWAVGVWGALLGSALLLLRSKWAFEVFIASLIAYVLSLVYSYAINPAPGMTGAIQIMQAVILIGCLFFAWYARFARKQGHLR